jgi:hypothetical protein
MWLLKESKIVYVSILRFLWAALFFPAYLAGLISARTLSSALTNDTSTDLSAEL